MAGTVYSTPSPLGDLSFRVADGRLITLDWGGGYDRPTQGVAKNVADQLAAYFAGELTRFDLSLGGFPSPFAERFAMALCDIPFGDTRSYGDIARALGQSAQSIGQACGANRIPIIVPCHRVMGASGLVGYSGAGGVETKVWLLRHEGAGGFLL